MLSFKDFLILYEHVLSIGLNPEHEKHREKHREEIHDMIKKSYEKIGGYGGEKSGSKEESDKIHHDISHSMIKTIRRNGKLTAVNLYKSNRGRKNIAIATDGTDQGKTDIKKIKHEDIRHKRSWGEYSGAAEHIQRKLGAPVIPNTRTKQLIGKDIEPNENGEHYTRTIGTEKRKKVILGHPKDQ